MIRPVRQRRTRGRSLVGERYTVEVGPVAHGGHFVARHEGRVIFVRHALPDEKVVVEVTEGSDDDRFLRADAVSVLSPSPDRVGAPCPYAGPGLCGGCDFQHVALARQRELKAAVVAEQLRRLAGLDVDVEMEAVPGDVEGLRWRTRIHWARTPDGDLGLRKHRSHDVVPVDDCRIAHPDVRMEVEDEPRVEDTVLEHVRGHAFQVAPDGFWQVHPGAPVVLVDAVLDGLDGQAGERALDLYSGVGLFSVFLAEAVGAMGRVLAIESSHSATDRARANVAAYPWVEVVADRVDRALARGAGPADLVVLDPPREGARRPVVEAVAALEPRKVSYVACDPAALARDTAIFAERGYGLASLRAFDLFPMTHHVECVALLTKTGSDLR